jgi:hypothetical protein
MYTRVYTVIICFLAVSALLLMGLGWADTDSEGVQVNVTVSTQTRIDLNPNSIGWGPTEPGTTNDTHFSLELENIGTRDITTVYADASNAASNPFATSDPAKYNATEFVLLNSSTVATFYYADIMTWNESKPGYIIPPAGWVEGNSTGHFGKFRTVSLGSGTADVGQQYYWFTAKGTTNCSDGGSVYLATTPRTETQDGTTDFTAVTPETLVGNPDLTWGYANIDNGGDAALQLYAVGVKYDCTEVVIFRYNKGLCTSCSDAAYIYSGTLTPGAKTGFWAALKVPQGVPDGALSSGYLTFTAEGV